MILFNNRVSFITAEKISIPIKKRIIGFPKPSFTSSLNLDAPVIVRIVIESNPVTEKGMVSVIHKMTANARTARLALPFEESEIIFSPAWIGAGSGKNRIIRRDIIAIIKEIIFLLFFKV